MEKQNSNTSKKYSTKQSDVFYSSRATAWLLGVINTTLLVSLGPIYFFYEEGLGGFLSAFLMPIYGVIYLVIFILIIKWSTGYVNKGKNKMAVYINLGIIILTTFFIVFNMAIIRDIMT